MTGLPSEYRGACVSIPFPISCVLGHRDSHEHPLSMFSSVLSLEPRRDHALAMCRFAEDCLSKSSTIFHALEITLGPGTSSLAVITISPLFVASAEISTRFLTLPI